MRGDRRKQTSNVALNVFFDPLGLGVKQIHAHHVSHGVRHNEHLLLIVVVAP